MSIRARGYRGPDQEYLDVAGALVTYVLAGLLPELQLLCLPLGVLLVLPNSCNNRYKHFEAERRRRREPRLKKKTGSDSALLGCLSALLIRHPSYKAQVLLACGRGFCWL